MMRKVFVLLTAIALGISSYCQQLDKKEFKNLFLDAEYYFLFENYKKALDLYLYIYNNDNYQATYNANLNYRIGFCYLQDNLNSYKGFPFLEKAAKNITLNYAEGSATESQAPIDAFYYLGDAYRNIFEFDKAIFAYQKYENFLDVSEIDLLNNIRRTIQSCKNAKELMLLSEHNYVEAVNLGPEINSAYPEYNPVVSGDQNSLVFTARKNYNIIKMEQSKDNFDKVKEGEGELEVDDRMFDEDIYWSKKVDGKWTQPVKISNMLGTDFSTQTVSMSYDGTMLFLRRIEIGFGNVEYSNLYVSYLENGRWSEMEKLNKNINTKGFEMQAAISADNKTLFFTSEREDGYGGLDIYMSEKDATGDWGPAVNLGPTINTEFNEEFPFILNDGKTLFFSSQGHFNMGGYDVFYTRQIEKGVWSVPINLGFPINTMEDNKFFFPLADGTEAYAALNSNTSYGNEDIFFLKITNGIDFTKYLDKNITNLAEIQDENKGEHTLQSKVSFEMSFEDQGSQIFSPFELSPASNKKAIFREARGDTEELLKKARGLKKEADIAYLIAEEKNQLAKEKEKEAEELMQSAVNIADENLRRIEISKAEQIKKEATLLAIIAYNLAEKLDETAMGIKDLAGKNGDFVTSLEKDSLLDIKILADRLNKNRETLNKEMKKFIPVEEELNQTRNMLAQKARKLAFHQSKLEVLHEEINFVTDTIEARKHIMSALDVKIAGTQDEALRTELEDEKEQLLSEITYLSYQLDKLKEQQFNAVSNFEKLSSEANFLSSNVSVLTTCTHEIATNTLPVAALTEKATIARRSLEGAYSAETRSRILNPIVEPEEVMLSSLNEGYLSKATLENVELTLNKIGTQLIAENSSQTNSNENLNNNSTSETNVSETESETVEANSETHSENTSNAAISNNEENIETSSNTESVVIAENSIAENSTETSEVNNSEIQQINTDSVETVTENINSNESTVISTNETSQNSEITENVENTENTNNELISSNENSNTSEVLVEETQENTNIVSQENENTSGDVITSTEATASSNNTSNENTELATSKRVLLKGSVKLADNKELDNSFVVSLESLEGNAISSAMPNKDGAYSFEIDPGSYKLNFKGAGYQPTSEMLVVPPAYSKSNIMLNTTLQPEDVASGEYFVSKAVFFEFGESDLNRESQIELEKLYLLMKDNPSLYFEVTGYTDSKGSSDFNKKLADTRARNVVQYLSNKGIAKGRFVSKGLGESNFVAINENPDGTDNPEGRKYNRRVEIKLLNSTNDKIIVVPDHLALAGNQSFMILLEKAEKEKPSDYFNKFNNNALTGVKMHRIKNGCVYTAGNYTHRSDALEDLNSIIESGLKDAKIISAAELEEMRKSYYEEIKSSISNEESNPEELFYTIQVAALRAPVSKGTFKQIKDIVETLGADNIYRYTFGQFFGLNYAKKELDKIQKKGYPDAFLVKMDNQGDGNLEPAQDNGPYTIQIKAGKSADDMTHFNGIEGIQVHKCNDGLYRYSYGSYGSVKEAREELSRVQSAGFKDAFIVNINRYSKL